MKALRHLFAVCAVCVLSAAFSHASEPAPPDYILKARALTEQAKSKSAGMKEFSDSVLIGQNYLLRAEAEYKKNLSWGKVEQKAEPTVRYLADMARLQASIVLSQIGKIEQEKEQLRLEGVMNEVRAKLKVFDDRNADISALKVELARRDAAISELKSANVEQKKLFDSKQAENGQLNGRIAALSADLAARNTALAAADAKIKEGSNELKNRQTSIAALEQKLADMAKSLEASKGETARLRGELSALAVQKGAAETQSQEQIQALKRSQEFVAEMGKLGGVIKAGSDNMTVIFGRTSMLKSPKSDALTVDGDKAVGRIAELLKAYPEFRVRIRIHGFGAGKTEDASATDRMARLIRGALLEKGKFDPATVEALGAGPAEPIYPKNNPEGNRRVEVTFVKK